MREGVPRLLLLGADGQVGWELARTLAPLGDVRAIGRNALDLTDLNAVRAIVRVSHADVVVNAAAYTHVDRAESESAVAHRVNGEAPEALAAEVARAGALLVHYSTDYVFDGTSSVPYSEQDPPMPRSEYGKSKLRGEEAVLASPAAAYVFRLSWVYSTRGRNFLETIRRLISEKGPLRVVADQYGAPTWSRLVAEATAVAIGRWLGARKGEGTAPERGIYHMAAWDYTTWYGFASAIVEAMAAADHHAPRVRPISTAEYPTAAQRPAWSVLDSTRLEGAFGLRLPPWRMQLALCLDSQAHIGARVSTTPRTTPNSTAAIATEGSNTEGK